MTSNLFHIYCTLHFRTKMGRPIRNEDFGWGVVFSDCQLSRISHCIFSGRYAPLTYYKDVSRNMLIARNAREICTFFAHLYLHTDKAKIIEQNKSIAVGPFYIGTYFEPIWTLLPEDVAVLNPTGYRGP